MILTNIFSLLVIFSFFPFINSHRNAEIYLIRDLLSRQIERNIVTGFLCWEKDELVKLQSTLSSVDVMSNIRKERIDNYNVPHVPSHFVIMDLRCPDYAHMLRKANHDRLFHIKFRWLVFTNFTNEEIKPHIDDLDIFIDSRFIVAQNVSSGDFLLDYAYRRGPEVGVDFHRIGRWSLGQGFLSYYHDIISRQRQNMRGYPLRVAFVIRNNDSINHLDDYRYGNIDTQLKLNHKFSSYVFEYFNATMVSFWEAQWGLPDGNGSWDGVIGRLHRHTIDISGAPFFCVPERLIVMDCISMTTPSKGFFIFRSPPLSYVANIFTLPFETDLWMSNMAFLLICSVFLYGVVVWEWKILSDFNKCPDYDQISKNFWDSIMFSIGAVCQQGYPTEPKSSSGKIIILTLFITLIFLFTAFSANTVVLFQSYATNIKTLDDLYNSKMTLGVDDKWYYRYWFPTYTEPTRRKIYLDRIIPKGEKEHFYPLEEGVERMRQGYFAFHIDEVSGYKTISDTFQEHEKCGLQIIHYLQIADPWITTPLNSTYREMFYIAYKLLVERGVQRRIIKQLYTSKPECVSQGSNFRSAGILDLYALYLVFGFGIGCSLFLLLLEVTNQKVIEPRLKRKYNLEKETGTETGTKEGETKEWFGNKREDIEKIEEIN